MPNIRAAAKRVRADKKRHLTNLTFKSELKTFDRKFRQALKSGQAKEIFALYAKRLDQAASKKLIHRNAASRKKSRLARQLAKLSS